jgi:hypothetical protein
MDAKDIAVLGDPKADGIPLGNSGIYNVKADSEISGAVVNWDNNEIYIKFAGNTDLSQVKVDFDIPYGAYSSIKSGSLLNLNSIGKEYQTIKITSEDGTSRNIWTLIPIQESIKVQ